ncbi:peptidoglycan-binding protein [Roseibium sp.]|uniref:peptidoglycan-binding protein n=1 Tax=Roseibium sp. TaxID=1936156 RepID=UPI003A971064
MPAWKNREAGRRGRRINQPLDEQHPDDAAPRRSRASSGLGRERPDDRIERLTRTATSLGGRQSHPGNSSELEAVASELDRLLSAREERGARVRERRVERPARDVTRVDRDKGVADRGRLDDVMGALERLDRKVEGLVSRPLEPEVTGHDDNYDALPDAMDEYAGYDDHYEDSYEAPRDDRAYDYSDDNGAYAYAEPAPGRARSSVERSAYADAQPSPYKDIGRRIDALRKPQAEAFDRFRHELGSLREAIGGYSAVTHERVGKQNAELRRLANMVERLRVEQKDDRLAKEIRKEVAELKSLVGRTNVDGTLKTLEHGYAHILQRLDELTRASIDPRVLRGVTARLNEIEDAFASLPRGEHMLALEDRISDISDRMEELLGRSDHSDIEPLRSELRDVRSFVEQIDIGGLVESIDDRMKFVSGRLDDLEILAREQRGLDTRITAMEERLPDAEMLNRLQGRLEDIVGMMSDERASPLNPEKYGAVGSKLEEIVGRLDRMEKIQPQADNEAFAMLEERLTSISSKIDSMEKKASRPTPVLDAASAMAAGGDAKAFAELQTRISDLSKLLERPSNSVTTADLDALRVEIGEMRKSVDVPASTQALEKRISDLAEAVARGGEGIDDSRLDQLGSKVAALAEQLENTSSRSDELERVTTALARIEDGLKSTRADVVEIAQKAAKEAVVGKPGGRSPDYDAAIDGLQSDLRRLLDAAEGAEERTVNTFNGVQAVLTSLTDRLERLEKIGSRPVSGAAAEVTAPREAGFFGKGLGRSRQADAEDDRASERGRDRKADFIAAARRAAQAASQEAAMLDVAAEAPSDRPRDPESSSAERAGWLRSVLKRGKQRGEDADDVLHDEDKVSANAPEDAEELLAGDRPVVPEDQATGGGGRRRALLFAAAAVVLTIGALQVFKLVGTSPNEPEQTAMSMPDSVGDNVMVAPQAPVLADGGNDSAIDAQTADEAISLTDLGTPQVEDTPLLSPDEAGELVAEASTDEPGLGDLAEGPSVPTVATGPEEGATDALAFAPPSGVSSSFGEGVPSPESGDLQPLPDAMPASVVANLPPEEVGTMALRSAAASGNPAAAFLVGVRFTEGAGIPANLSEAAKWYQKAAEQGLAPAQYRLASLYEKGRGVERDPQLAREWYTKAAEAGNTKAMHNLAVLHAEGAEGAPDFTQAAKWFESAANFGVKDSLFNLGILYARGLGVEKDLVASYKWFAIAAEQGDRDAAKKRDDVANMMDQDTLAAARLAVESFQLKTPDPAANKVATEPGWASATGMSTNASAILDDVVDYEAMVREAQAKLNELGFETGTPDGQMGPRTRSAIRAFQRSLGRAETGEVDAGLIKDLESQSI